MNQEIKIIPEASHIHLSEEVFSYLLMQVPAGRLTRYKDMEAYLAKRFSVHHIQMENLPFMSRVAFSPEYIYKVLDNVPRHREVSARGYLIDVCDQAEKLSSEGMEILPPARSGYNARVKDYKKYLFDFEKETNVELDTLMEVHKNGLSAFFVGDT